jgi:hypothetical protein
MSTSTTALTKTTIIIVSKTGSLSECVVETKKETTIEELVILLSKKCGFRNPEGFTCRHTWKYRNRNRNRESENDTKYIYVDIWAKTDGRSGQENKYEFPPPIDEQLFFGNIALVARIDNERATDMNMEMWNKIYESLFGGFENLADTAEDDENEVDELDSIPNCKKTSAGYLKDGFVVEDDQEETPRYKRKTRKKCKSESTESEFITETETESDDTPRSDTDGGEPIITTKIVTTKPIRTNKKPVSGKSKKNVIEEPVVAEESESELSEESYD